MGSSLSLAKNRAADDYGGPFAVGSILEDLKVVQEHDDDAGRGIETDERGNQTDDHAHHRDGSEQTRHRTDNDTHHEVDDGTDDEVGHGAGHLKGQGEELLQDIHLNILLNYVRVG